MFGFFRNKKNKAVAKPDPQAKQPSVEGEQPRIYYQKDYETVLRAYFRPGDFAALYFAKCAGLEGSTISQDNSGEFLRIILSTIPEDIDMDGKRVGFKYFESEIIAYLKSGFSFKLKNGEHGDKQAPLPNDEEVGLIKEIATLIRRNRYQKISEIFKGFDPTEVTFRYVEMLRRNDLEMMLVELNKRRDKVIKIFRQIRNTSINKYGDFDEGPALDEMEEFLNYAFNPEDFKFFYTLKPLGALTAHVDDMIDQIGNASDEIPIDGIEFEHWCADKIRHQGWQVSVSSASGDQGVDVVAERDGTVVAIQCKRYSNPIGNKAVQEAFTGGQNVGAGHSCVLGTGGFTRSAIDIANKTGVKLVDAGSIGQFSQEFGFESLKELNDETSEIDDDADDVLVSLSFDGVGGGLLGTLLRSGVNHNNSDQLGLNKSTAEMLLHAVDKDTGAGEISAPRQEVAMLFLLGAKILKTRVELNEYNLKSISQSPFYDQVKVSQHAGDSVAIGDLVRDEALEGICSFIRSKADCLGPMYQSFVSEEVFKLLDK